MADNDFGGQLPVNYEQKCPCILVVDTSGSMYREPISELNKGLKEFQAEISNDLTAFSRLEVSIVTFDSSVKVKQDFSLLSQFQMPTLSISGTTTRMVDGVKKAIDQVTKRREYYKQTGQTYYRPYIILMTDGYPDHDQDTNWLKNRIDQGFKDKEFLFWAFGSAEADMNLLKSLAHDGSVVQMIEGTEFVKFFRWLSSSLSKISTSKEDDIIDVTPESADSNPFQIVVK